MRRREEGCDIGDEEVVMVSGAASLHSIYAHAKWTITALQDGL